MQFISEPARDGKLYLNVITEEGSVRLNSNYRPIEEALRWAAGVELPVQGAVVLMFGMGNGYCVRAMLDKMSADAALILYEPSGELLSHVKENYELQDILEDARLHLIVKGQNEQQIFALLDTRIHWSNAKKQVFCVHPQYDKVFPAELKAFQELVSNNNIRVYTNRNTEMHFGEAIANNVTGNIRYVPEAVTLQELAGRFPKNAPAILVAAGPSLDKNAGELKNAKGKAFILAVDTAMRTLHAHGVMPDAVVSVDPKIAERHFEGTDYAQLPLFAKPQSNIHVLENHHAQKIWFDMHEYVKRFYRSIGRTMADYHSGASVATAGFSICAALGFQRIILVGQDLAYLGDVTHAGGTVMHIQAEEENIAYVDGYYGGKVKTRHDWLQYLHWFERVISQVRGELEVIDATEGGALIRGAVQMPLAEAIQCYGVSCDFAGVLEKYGRCLTEAEKKRFDAYIGQSIGEAQSVCQISAEILESCRRAAELDLKGKMRICTEIAHKAEALSRMNVYLLADDATKKVSIPAITEMTETEGTEEEYLLARLRCYETIYEALGEAAAILTEVLHNAI